MGNANLALWNSVCKTDPRNTKRVDMRGGFTAIKPHSQIMAATEQFGPAGDGFWWESVREPHETLWIEKVSLYAKGYAHPVTHYGSAALISAKGHIDADAPKKALTDGLTKCLSYWGFNADVFLGRFEDSKYVSERTSEARAPECVATLDEWLAEHAEAIRAAMEKCGAALTKRRVKEIAEAEDRNLWKVLKVIVTTAAAQTVDEMLDGRDRPDEDANLAKAKALLDDDAIREALDKRGLTVVALAELVGEHGEDKAAILKGLGVGVSAK